MRGIAPVTLADVRDARVRIAETVLRTPLIQLERTDGRSIGLKLECLQPIGSFKIRGALNAISMADADRLTRGVYTASAGNMAQGVAYGARSLGLSCRVIVPDSAPATKLRAIERLGGVCVPVPFEEWWRAMLEHGREEEDGLFIHPVADHAVIAGNGTIGLEILEDAPDVETIVVPFGGGGQACGIAAAVKAVRPGVRVIAAEVETAAPLAASLAAGRPTTVHREASFVDGIGAGGLLPEMWPLASSLLDGSVVVTLAEVRAAIRLLARDVRVVAEGAGAASVAACLRDEAVGRRAVAVVSGGNIDADVLAAILTERD